MNELVTSITGEFRRYKSLAEGAIRQLADDELMETPYGAGNSVATLVWHIAGNLKSRFTDFLTSDGEKRWRDRESEFQSRTVTREQVLEKWEDGWSALLEALDTLGDEDALKSVTIRGVLLSVQEALHRSLSHAAYHVGQIVALARAIRGSAWEFLSIPPGDSAQYNKQPNREKPPGS